MKKYKHKPIIVEIEPWTGRDETLRLLKNNGLKNYKVGWFSEDGNLYEHTHKTAGCQKIMEWLDEQ